MIGACSGTSPGERSARPLALAAAGATDIGGREHNEDHVLLRPEIGLYVLADGAGGHNAGNVASALATTTVANVFESSAVALAARPEIDGFGLSTRARRLSAAVHRANAEIIDIAKKSSKYHGMGTTLVALAFAPDGDTVHVAHVGDSRCYRWRGGHLEAMTTDHSLLVDILEAHPEADDALLDHAPRNAVTRALGMDVTVRVPMRSLRVAAGDLYLLCSDGVTAVLDDGLLETLLAVPRSPQAHVDALIGAALDAGAEDNVAAILVESRERESPSRRSASSRPVSAVASSRAAVDRGSSVPDVRAPVGSGAPPSPRRPVAPVGARAPMGSEPEIVIVGVETHIVPGSAGDPKVLDAVGRLARLRQPSSPEITRPKPVRCAACGQPFEADASACPTCGRGAVTAR